LTSGQSFWRSVLQALATAARAWARRAARAASFSPPEGAAILTRLYPNDLAKRVDLVNDTAVLLTKQALWTEAIKTLETIEKDLPSFAKLGGQSVRDALIMRYNLDAIRIRVGRYEGVETRLKQLLKENSQLYGRDNQQSANVIDKLGSLACETGRFSDCLALRRDAFAMRKRQIGVDPSSVADAQLDQLSMEIRLEKINRPDAMQQLTALLSAIPKHMNNPTADRADFYRQLSDVACLLNAFPIAKQAQEKGRADLIAINNANPELAAQLDRTAALVAYLRGDARAAVDLLGARFRRYELVAEGDTPRHATLWLQRALYELDFDKQAAVASLARARVIFQHLGEILPHWQAMMAYVDAKINFKSSIDAGSSGAAELLAAELRAAEDAVDRAYLRARPDPWRAPQLPSL